VYGAIGGPGVVARGVRRVTPWNAGDPPFPGEPPVIVPLFDGSGNPLPAEKGAVWRAPVASGFDGWVWFDDTSKDQVSGYALAAAWLWDALRDDPAVDPAIPAALAADLQAFARALMQVAPETGTDLSLRDADGRLTSFHDLNPRLIGPDADPLPEDYPIQNGFNALLALGIVRAAYHASGDPVIGAWYYEELIGRRNMAVIPTTTVSLMYLGPKTNYSNVNMAAIGLATLGRFETDPYVREQLRLTLETQFYDAGVPQDAANVRQAWFDAIFAAYSPIATGLVSGRIRENLGAFPPAPGFERERINCDEAEIAARSCIGLDGTTMLELWEQSGHNGQAVAKNLVPMAIRPDSDFHWRSDPHEVNGGASTKMGPRGDWIAAYWLSRASEVGSPDANLSPNARPPLPYTLPDDCSGGGGGGAPATAGDDDGCSCASAADGAPDALALTLALAAALGVRRRRAISRSSAA
jgi:MYXO-CTERM domain-containing protein